MHNLPDNPTVLVSRLTCYKCQGHGICGTLALDEACNKYGNIPIDISPYIY